MNAVKNHYDCLIDENNDPVHDAEPLKEYMNQWDGQVFIDELELNNTKTVLEIGVGTGRIAIKIISRCKHFTGIDISEKTIERAKENLSLLENKTLICSDFFECAFKNRFDVIYSSLRFLYKGIIIKHNKTEPTYTKTSLFLCEKRRFFMARTEKGVVTTI